MKPGWQQTSVVVVVVLVNAAVLAYTVSGTRGQQSQAFAQPYENGVACTAASQCLSNICATVCCDRQCNAPGQSCVVPGSVGTCVNSAQSPVLSLPFQWVAASLVALIAVLRLRRRSG